MGTRDRRIDVGRSRGRELVLTICREIAAARRTAALSQALVADQVGVSPSQYSRVERGRSPNAPIPTLAGISAVLGLDLAVRLDPAGDAVRDAAQVALLARLRARLHPSLVWHTEVPLPGPGDRRAYRRHLTVGPSRASAGLERHEASRSTA